jgi:hypothetical protein
MQNKIFNVVLNKTTGSIEKLSLKADKDGMNFVYGGSTFGDVFFNFLEPDPWMFKHLTMPVVEFNENDDEAFVRFEMNGFELTAHYYFEDENLKIDYKYTNKNRYPYYFNEGDVRVRTPFNDCYIGSENCAKACCHEHLWPGGESSYIFAERMINSKNSIGVFFHEGNFTGYTQILPNMAYCNGSYRGEMAMNLAPVELLEGDSVSFGITVFAASDKEDFIGKLKTFDRYLHVEADKFTVEIGEPIRFSVTSKNVLEQAECYIGEEKIPFTVDGKSIKVEYTPKTTGEKKIYFRINGVESYARFNVIIDVEELVRRRIEFIVDKQQCLDSRSPLYGAYLLYDNKTERQMFHYLCGDHNACKERFGMSTLIAKWLQTHENEKVRKSLDLFLEFMFRECVNKDTGVVSHTILNDPENHRLYNIPWVMNLLDEMYKLTGDLFYVDVLIKVTRYYYADKDGTGDRFYPDGCMFANSLQTIIDAGKRAEAEDVFARFDTHIENIIDIGPTYPSHEVFYEQAIVAPAVTLILDKYRLSGEKKYLEEAEKHLAVLRRFDGLQPDHRLHNIATRYWDDFWFGKSYMYVDTMPHYWSAYSGVAFAYYGKLAGNEKAIKYGVECAMNNLSSFDEEGRGYAAYIYPDFINDREGKFLDDYSNDQDLGLYFVLQILELAK